MSMSDEITGGDSFVIKGRVSQIISGGKPFLPENHERAPLFYRDQSAACGICQDKQKPIV